jgi:hypothetical protein
MPDDQRIFKRRAITFAILSFIFFCSIFIFSPLGSFFVWISIGGTLYCMFYSIFNLVLRSKSGTTIPYKSRKQTASERSVEEHMRYHLPILISLFLGGLLLVLIFWLFFT